MKAFNRALGRNASYGPLIVRVVLGALFVWHGIDKFDTGISNVEGFFDSNGVPLPSITAPLVAILEIVGGLALAVGLFTRLTALTLAGILLGAIIFVKGFGNPLGDGAELDLVYIAGLLGVALTGPGRPSVDEAIKSDETLIDLRASGAPAPGLGAQKAVRA